MSEVTRLERIRNFSIIAHIDHGKSTLADRLLEITGAVNARDFRPQFLDRLDVERDRGVTVKLQAVRISYTSRRDGEVYVLNLIDTPGHVDFSYEVSRSLAACEGVLLVVDASQGIEAQTMAHFYLAREHNLVIIPVINKIDLPTADIERVKEEIELVLGLDSEKAILVSAKDGSGTEDLLEAIVERVPPPETPSDGAAVRALVFDSHYDTYRGAIAYARVFSGEIKKGGRIRLMEGGTDNEVTEVGVFKPEMSQADRLSPGEVGYIVAAIKDIQELQVGDTITLADAPASEPLPGYRRLKSMVYCGFFASEAENYEDLRDALEKLALNDAALSYEPESSSVLGFGFRCGFLGLFHMEIIQERLEREYGIGLVATAPTVVYRVFLENGKMTEIKNPSEFPDSVKIAKVEEPYVRASIFTPEEYIGPMMELAKDKRGDFVTMDYISEKRVKIVYLLPLSEVIFDFFDKLKSNSHGYASLDYEYDSYRESNLVKLDVLINDKSVDSLSMIVHRDSAYYRGRRIAEKLRELIPRHMFAVPIQAAIGGRIIARETIPAMRKNVTSKCYGGDITRKRKLLEKQKEGKKRMKSVGSVEIPQEAFLSILSIEKEK
ncbi:MAG TPA: translation elongation factor 4 [bacterium]|nr:translation elongation factor 4 [bacterium]